MSYDFNEAKEHIVNSYGRLEPVITHGEGVYLYDADENKYLDFTSGIGVSSLGYNHEILDTFYKIYEPCDNESIAPFIDLFPKSIEIITKSRKIK